jgi:hypothetical protein
MLMGELYVQKVERMGRKQGRMAGPWPLNIAFSSDRSKEIVFCGVHGKNLKVPGIGYLVTIRMKYDMPDAS